VGGLARPETGEKQSRAEIRGGGEERWPATVVGAGCGDGRSANGRWLAAAKGMEDGRGSGLAGDDREEAEEGAWE